MLRSKKLVSIVLAMIMVLSIGCLNACAEQSVDTTSRGYQLINGDVYDLYGKMLIKMNDGFTWDGYTLDPNFTVYYPNNVSESKNMLATSSTRATYIFNGTADLPLNTNGNQGVYWGGYFTLSSSEPRSVVNIHQNNLQV